MAETSACSLTKTITKDIRSIMTVNVTLAYKKFKPSA
jgi:hypothetical protein